MSFRKYHVVFLVLLIAAGVASGAEPFQYKGLEKLPDPTKGEIAGQPAIVIWPVDNQKRELLDPNGCQVILERHDTEEFSYVRYPCGKWFVPPIAKYDMFLEMPGFVSDYVSIYAFGGGQFKGMGSRSLHPVVPAGLIRTKADFKIPRAAESFRVLSLRDQWIAYQRVVAAAEASNGVSVPAGQVVAGFFDASGKALALSRPFEVKAGTTTEFAAVPPQKGSDLLLVISKVGPSDRSSRPGLEVSAGDSAKKRSPDMLLDSRDNLFAIWYGLTEKRVEVTAEPLSSQPERVVLSPGQVTTLRIAFVTAPPGLKQ